MAVTRSARSAFSASKSAAQRRSDDPPDLVEVVDLQAAGGQRARADAQAARDHRGARIEGHRVAVDRDADVVEAVLGLLAVELRLAQVDEHQVHVGPARQHVDTRAGGEQFLGQRLGTGHGAALALAEELGLGDAEGHCLARDDVLERPALLAGEDGRVDRLGVLLAAQDDSAARAAQRLVHRRGDDVGVGHRARVLARGDQAGEVGHVDDEVGADRVGDRAEPLEVQEARVCAPAGEDQLRPALVGDALDLVHVDEARLARDLVGRDVVQAPGNVELHAVGQVAAVGKRQAHDRVARLQERVVDGGVGLGAGVRLHVGVVGSEERLRAIDRQLLNDVDVLAAAVVALAGIALRVLVGQHAALALEDRLGDEVLRGDHLERSLLAVELVLDGVGDLGIDLGQRAIEEVGTQVGHGRSSAARGLCPGAAADQVCRFPVVSSTYAPVATPPKVARVPVSLVAILPSEKAKLLGREAAARGQRRDGGAPARTASAPARAPSRRSARCGGRGGRPRTPCAGRRGRSRRRRSGPGGRPTGSRC